MTTTNFITLTELGGLSVMINPAYIAAVVTCESEGRVYSEIRIGRAHDDHAIAVQESLDVIKASIFMTQQQDILAQSAMLSGSLKSIIPPTFGDGGLHDDNEHDGN